MEFTAKIALCGFMGSGKTSVGKCLANFIEYKFIDIDEAIEKEESMGIPEIFERYGESKFRAIERRVLSRALSKYGTVISCGGGSVIFEDNVNLLKSSGALVIFLDASPGEIKRRLKYDNTRPLLQGSGREDKIDTLLKIRNPIYKRVADIVVSADEGPEKVAREIIKRIKEAGK